MNAIQCELIRLSLNYTHVCQNPCYVLNDKTATILSNGALPASRVSNKSIHYNRGIYKTEQLCCEKFSSTFVDKKYECFSSLRELF